MKLLFIVGMQKSGTSLLNRMLMKQDFINNPFLPEGKYFWGDNPPFDPIEAPCGELFQRHNGLHGHYLDQLDFKIEDKQLLFKKINEAQVNEPILMNKNPYNSVRLKWLKTIFPECKIVSMYRNPIANIYSLLKKYKKTKGEVQPDKGWWGIKPKDWVSLCDENKLIQSSKQWIRVNEQILSDLDQIDLLVNYDDLCSNPNEVLLEVVGERYKGDLINMTKCKNLNNEYLTGSRLLSKNREFRKEKGFSLEHLEEVIEIPPLNQTQVVEIERYCSRTWNQLINSTKNFGI